jgi:YHS domain-containing protein
MSMSAWGDTTVDTVTDPVCGMLIDSGEAEVASSYDGIVYYFCSVDCRDRFEEHPDTFLEEHSLFQRSEDQEVLPD